VPRLNPIQIKTLFDFFHFDAHLDESKNANPSIITKGITNPKTAPLTLFLDTNAPTPAKAIGINKLAGTPLAFLSPVALRIVAFGPRGGIRRFWKSRESVTDAMEEP
jgi:hypothetical protein